MQTVRTTDSTTTRWYRRHRGRQGRHSRGPACNPRRALCFEGSRGATERSRCSLPWGPALREDGTENAPSGTALPGSGARREAITKLLLCQLSYGGKIGASAHAWSNSVMLVGCTQGPVRHRCWSRSQRSIPFALKLTNRPTPVVERVLGGLAQKAKHTLNSAFFPENLALWRDRFVRMQLNESPRSRLYIAAHSREKRWDGRTAWQGFSMRTVSRHPDVAGIAAI